MREVVVRMPDMRCNMAYPAGLRGVLTCPVTKKKCCGQAEIHCPIVCLLPENHGRLVDADKIDYYEVERFGEPHYMVWKPHIDGQPTIVPATETEATPCP